MLLFGLIIIIVGLLLLMALEQIMPDRKLNRIPGWWIRVIVINLSQLAIVILASLTWEKWLESSSFPRLFYLGEFLNTYSIPGYRNEILGGFIAYLVNTWIFYWFHRARHEIYLLWISLHQIHHSPSRIETITSFYKHPLEIAADSILMAILLYPILGLSKESSIWLSVFSAYGEYFYHMNIKTPHWLGYIFQRPESHRVHHLRNKRENCKNYSDLPLWDILSDTFENPTKDVVLTGFEEENEVRFNEMLFFQDVLASNKSKDTTENSQISNIRNVLSCFLLIIGLLQPIGYLFNQPTIRGLGLITTASPLPLVFSAYNGVETFATSFEIILCFEEDTRLLLKMGKGSECIPEHMQMIRLTKELYSKLEGPYNRRNIFGVVLSHGPFFTHPDLIRLRDEILHYMICYDRLDLRKSLGISIEKPIRDAGIIIRWPSQKRIYFMKVDCPLI